MIHRYWPAALLALVALASPQSSSAQALDCSSAGTIRCGETVNGNSAGAPSNVNIYSCTVLTTEGPEQVWAFTAGVDDVITATLSGLTQDLDLIILDACDETTLGCSSATMIDANDEVVSTAVTAGSTYYLVVDTFLGGSTYTLELTCAAGPLPVEARSWSAVKSEYR